ncbi:hypothetical protein JCM19232_2622 [Vibrio ishigakensis]|uniref:Uncharacterized protein n=1 Tax=Vibrio ishigakensis TaxID=1481914 RepID=A0A0B8PG91_9VIBR|nr:hypothetical protein JCM19232_2622 [Vibrio ishigakensis]
MLEAVDRERRGELKLHSEELVGLPINSVKNENDLARERAIELGLHKPENFRKGSVFKRIAELGCDV